METNKRWLNRVCNILFVVPGYESYLNTLSTSMYVCSIYVAVHLNLLNIFNEVNHKRSFPAF